MSVDDYLGYVAAANACGVEMAAGHGEQQGSDALPVLHMLAKRDVDRAAVRGAVERKSTTGAARNWLGGEIHRLRALRLTAINDEMPQVWSRLHQASTPTLEPLRLSGTSIRGRLDPNCTTEGNSARARSVLIQGSGTRSRSRWFCRGRCTSRVRSASWSLTTRCEHWIVRTSTVPPRFRDLLFDTDQRSATP